MPSNNPNPAVSSRFRARYRVFNNNRFPDISVKPSRRNDKNIPFGFPSGRARMTLTVDLVSNKSASPDDSNISRQFSTTKRHHADMLFFKLTDKSDR